MTKPSKTKTNKPIANGHGGFLTGQPHEIFVGTNTEVKKISARLGYEEPCSETSTYGKTCWVLVPTRTVNLFRFENHTTLWTTKRKLYDDTRFAVHEAYQRTNEIDSAKMDALRARKAAKNGLTPEEETLIKAYTHARRHYFKNQGMQVEHILKIQKRHELTEQMLKLMALSEEELLENSEAAHRVARECRMWDVESDYLTRKLRWVTDVRLCKARAEDAIAKCSPEVLQKFGL